MDQLSYAGWNTSPLRVSMGLLLTLALWQCSPSSNERNVDASPVDTMAAPADGGASPADTPVRLADADSPPADAGGWSAVGGLLPASMVTGLSFTSVTTVPLNPPPPVYVVVTDATRAQDAYSATIALPAFVPRISCPMDAGVLYKLAFSFSDGSSLIVTLDPGGCQVVQIPGSSDRVSFSSAYDYWNELTQDLGIPEATIFPYVPPAFQSNVDPQNVDGQPCTTDADCDADDRCGYRVSDSCAAKGICLVSACTGGNCAAAAAEICGCQGQPILPVWSQSSTTSVVAAYTSAPASGRLGPCTGRGDAGGTGSDTAADGGTGTDTRTDRPGKDGGGTCDPACQAKWPTWCVPVSSGECVECTTDADCAANPGANGPTCNTATNYCVCASDADCKNNLWGHACDKDHGTCGCTLNSDCGPGTAGTTCDSADGYCTCGSNADCSGSKLGMKCNFTDVSAHCTCGSDSDCPSSKSCTEWFGQGTWTYCQ